MKELSLPTKLYLAAIYFVGFGLFLWNIPYRRRQQLLDGNCFIFAGILFPDLQSGGGNKPFALHL